MQSHLFHLSIFMRIIKLEKLDGSDKFNKTSNTLLEKGFTLASGESLRHIDDGTAFKSYVVNITRQIWLCLLS